MPLVNEASCNTARSAVKIFVAAPDREIRTPFMKMQWNIASRMRQVKADDAASSPPGLRDAGHIENLPSRIVHSTDHDQCNGFTLALDQ